MKTAPSRQVRSVSASDQQGITLVTTLLLLLLLIGMSLTMVLAVSSESLINGYYGRYRGSFYAADSGVAAARQQVMNQLHDTVSDQLYRDGSTCDGGRYDDGGIAGTIKRAWQFRRDPTRR